MNDQQVLIRGVDVDWRLAKLLGRLWDQGIHTIASCQERSPGIGYIHFATQDDADRFCKETGLAQANLVVDFPTKSIEKLENVFALDGHRKTASVSASRSG